jgi:hypothetical protein
VCPVIQACRQISIEQVSRQFVGANDYNRCCNDSFYSDYGREIVFCDDFVLDVISQGTANWFRINETRSKLLNSVCAVLFLFHDDISMNLMEC